MFVIATIFEARQGDVLNLADNLLEAGFLPEFLYCIISTARQVLAAEPPGFDMPFRDDFFVGLPGANAHPVQLYATLAGFFGEFPGKLAEQAASKTIQAQNRN